MPTELPHPSPADAAARLRYAAAVKARSRRVLLGPSAALLALGALVLAHGLVVGLWPDRTIVTVAWFGGLLALRPVLLRLRRRAERRRGVERSPVPRLACGAAALAAAGLAVLAGVNPLVAAVATAAAVAASLAGLPLAAAAAALGGLVADLLVASGAGPAPPELVLGGALVLAGMVSLAGERRTP
jgi:hypothetical protein